MVNSVRQITSHLIAFGFCVYAIGAATAISLSQIGIYIAVFFWLLRVILYKEKPFFPLLTPIVCYIFFYLTSIVFAEYPIQSLRNSRELFQILIFFLVANALTDQKLRRRVLALLVLSTSAVSLYALCQLYANGLDYRVKGTLSIYMTFAGVLVLVNCLAIAEALRNARKRGRLKRWLAPVLLSVALTFTYTRNAWLGFGCGLTYLIAARNRNLLVLMISVIALVLLFAPPQVLHRLASFTDQKDSTAMERIVLWKSGLKMIRDYPIVGLGTGKFKKTLNESYQPENVSKQFSHLHNTPLQIAAEIGVPGMISWLFIMAMFFCRVRYFLKREEGPSHAERAIIHGSVAGVIAILVAGMFECNFADSEVRMLLYFVMGLPFAICGRRSSAKVESLPL